MKLFTLLLLLGCISCDREIGIPRAEKITVQRKSYQLEYVLSMTSRTEYAAILSTWIQLAAFSRQSQNETLNCITTARLLWPSIHLKGLNQ